jgi:hypothetical protein
MYKVAESSSMCRNTPRFTLWVTFPSLLPMHSFYIIVGIYNNMVTFAGDKRLWAVDIGQMWVDRNETESSALYNFCAIFGTGR